MTQQRLFICFAILSLTLVGCLTAPAFNETQDSSNGDTTAMSDMNEEDTTPDASLPDMSGDTGVDMIPDGEADTVDASDASNCEVTGTEICDNLDNNCDGSIDEGCDNDGDEYCDESLTVVGMPDVCPLGQGDCNDDDPLVHPGAIEVCGAPADSNCVVGDEPGIDIQPFQVLRGPRPEARSFDMAHNRQSRVVMAWVEEGLTVPQVHFGAVDTGNGAIVDEAVISSLDHAVSEVAVAYDAARNGWLVVYSHESSVGPTALSYVELDFLGDPSTAEVLTTDIVLERPLTVVAAGNEFHVLHESLSTGRPSVLTFAPNGPALLTELTNAPGDLSLISMTSFAGQAALVWGNNNATYQFVVMEVGGGIDQELNFMYDGAAAGDDVRIHPGLNGLGALTWRVPDPMQPNDELYIASIDTAGTLSDITLLSSEASGGVTVAIFDPNNGMGLNGQVGWEEESPPTFAFKIVGDSGGWAGTPTITTVEVDLDSGAFGKPSADSTTVGGGNLSFLSAKDTTGVRLYSFDIASPNAPADSILREPVASNSLLTVPLYAHFDEVTDEFVVVQRNLDNDLEHVRIDAEGNVTGPTAMDEPPTGGGCSLLELDQLQMLTAGADTFRCIQPIEVVAGDCAAPMPIVPEYDISIYTYDPAMGDWNGDIVTTAVGTAIGSVCSKAPGAAFAAHPLAGGGDVAFYSQQHSSGTALRHVTRDSQGMVSDTIVRSMVGSLEPLAGGVREGTSTLAVAGAVAEFGTNNGGGELIAQIIDASTGALIADQDLMPLGEDVDISIFYFDGTKYVLGIAEYQPMVRTFIRFLDEEGTVTPAAPIDISAHVGQVARGAGGRPDYHVFAATNRKALRVSAVDDSGQARELDHDIPVPSLRTRFGIPHLTDDDVFRWLVWDSFGRILHFSSACQ